MAETPAGVRVGTMDRSHRPRVREVLARAAVFRAEEIDVALELFDETFPPTGERRGAVLPDYVFLGAFTPDDELVGYACYGPTPGTDRTYDLYWIVVDPAAQGAGGGTTLLHEVERRLTELHARMLVVETSSRSDYAAARGFYARQGYAAAARVRGFYAPGDDRVILTKRFQSSSRPIAGGGAVTT